MLAFVLGNDDIVIDNLDNCTHNARYNMPNSALISLRDDI